ncbi:hypothetical protein GIB67_032975 [Kingdonia uniflora]|uniref:FAD/NAD(P)-binding oxidoreductase family protein n=1 Tax=Kingdonia uniflora TaxID=39325 RepID=A0A7J7MY77_9MAGN|nr:hypothetical protein GIB67_032975 [Kingdonia uniflora]
MVILLRSNCLGRLIHTRKSLNTRRSFTTSSSFNPQQASEGELLVVVGGGAAGIYGAIRAKTLAPNLSVLVVEKAKPLSKVKVSGGGRCNVTNGHCVDKMVLADQYPRGNKELRGSFFNMHSPMDTMSWFSDHGVQLKTEEDGRVFPVSDSSSSIIDCLLNEAKRSGVSLQTGKVVTSASTNTSGKFRLKIEKRTIDFMEHVEADYLLIASGSNKQGYSLASQLGHSIIDPISSLFTFKVADRQLAELSGVTFPKVKAKLKLENVQRNIPQFTQPLYVNAGTLFVDFIPDLQVEDVKSIFVRHKDKFAKQKLANSFPPEFSLVKRFWNYVVDREGLEGDILWASISNNSLASISSTLKQCSFGVSGKGQFKDEFVTAGGVPLSEISLKTMESKIQPHLFFAGEVMNIDGVTGGFNFQNAWSGGYIAGSTVGKLASVPSLKEEAIGFM